MVLYLDIEYNHDGTRMDSFLAEIHEETQKRLEQRYPLLPASRNPLFHSFGKRLCELQASLAFLDILFGLSPKTGYRATLESWILALKDKRPVRYKVCFKVRYKGVLQDPSIAESRLATEFTSDASGLVSPLGPGTLKDAVRLAQTTANQMANYK